MTEPESFFSKLAHCPWAVLFLDYDGTLAPFQLRREEAFPYPGVTDLLRGIVAAGGTRLVVVSGRAIDDLLPLLGMEHPPEIWGSHGWERQRMDEERERFELPDGASAGLAAGLEWARHEGLGDRIEEKPACVALHWRGLPDAEIERLRDRTGHWQELARSFGLVVKGFDGGLELRVPGRDKGNAVSAVLSEMPLGSMAAYLGDDLTDEDAFRALGERGLSVLVRAEPRPTAAHLRLAPPEELLDFLDRWRGARGGR